jgi:predicted GTPase
MGDDGGHMKREKILILGAAGRDFHDFNLVFRDDPACEVVAFTAAQIPGIEGRRYPPELAGPLYPDGIPIEDEARLEAICAEAGIDRVVFAYSDLAHADVMHLASRALACGADFSFSGPRRTMLRSSRPVIAVSAVRTGCGKSQTARWLAGELRRHGQRVVALRHPMPYGDLGAQRLQRFASEADLSAADCTAEEREEYEPYVEAGCVVFAGVDFAAILAAAEAEADVVLWDGGNNDLPFVVPDWHIVVTDALRPDQLTTHHPGEAALRAAHTVVINKVRDDNREDVAAMEREIRSLLGEVPIVKAASKITLDDAAAVNGRRAIVVDDGPTLTHGGMPFGAGLIAARDVGAGEIIDPRVCAQGSLRAVFAQHPHLDRVLPAMGYDAAQRADLKASLDAAQADVIVSGTPIDLARLIQPRLPVVRARYAWADAGPPFLSDLLARFLASVEAGRPEPPRLADPTESPTEKEQA